MPSDASPTRQAIRLAITGILHETNTYAAASGGPTPLDWFRQFHGQDIVHRLAGTNSAVGGYLAACAAHGVQAVPAYAAQATPSATIAHEAYVAMRTQLLQALQAALPVQGVLMALHGAGVAEQVDDIEGDLLQHVRALVGPGVPIAATYDLHGNLSDAMVANADFTLPCRLYPHTDMAERAAEGVDLLLRQLKGDIGRPVTAARRLPILGQVVATEPGALPSAVNVRCAEVAAWPGVLDCSWFHGFPYADIAMPCVSVVCTTDGDALLAQRAVDHVADWIWQQRQAFLRPLISPRDGVSQALAATEGPVVVNENADNPGGGTPGDGTHLLRALLEARPPAGRACFGILSDPEVVQQAIEAGVGATLTVRLGGKRGPFQGQPIEAQAVVKCLTDGRFTNRPGSMLAGMAFNLGPMCRLVIDGVDVLVASRPDQTWDPEVFLLHGIDVQQRQVVAIKGANHFRAGFRGVARQIITVDSEGLSSADLSLFPRNRLAVALWPLSESVAPQAAAG